MPRKHSLLPKNRRKHTHTHTSSNVPAFFALHDKKIARRMQAGKKQYTDNSLTFSICTTAMAMLLWIRAYVLGPGQHQCAHCSPAHRTCLLNMGAPSAVMFFLFPLCPRSKAKAGQVLPVSLLGLAITLSSSNCDLPTQPDASTPFYQANASNTRIPLSNTRRKPHPAASEYSVHSTYQ